MPQAALLGQLVFTLHSKQFIEIKDQQISKQCTTKSWMHYIQGELYGDQPGSESFHLDVAIQQSIHQFHGESWSFFTFCDIWNESIGQEGDRLVGPGRGHFSSCGVISTRYVLILIRTPTEAGGFMMSVRI